MSYLINKLELSGYSSTAGHQVIGVPEMKIYYVEDNLFHQELFKKERMKYPYLSSLEVVTFPTNKLESVYKSLDSYTFSSSDFFVLDIDLKSLHTGIDFAKKIRAHNPNCFIIFLSNDSSRGLEIINQQIRPDLYLNKDHIDQIFTALEAAVKEKLTKQEQNNTIVELNGTGKIHLVNPDEINYITTVKGFRSSLEFFGVNENFIIQDKMKSMKDIFAEYHFFNELKIYSINPFNVKEVNKQTMEVIFKNKESLLLSPASIKKLLHYINTLQQQRHLP